MTLYAKRLNHGQSEVWLGENGKHRTIATNEVNWQVRKHSSKEESESFYATLHSEMGNTAEVFAGDAIVAELGF